jgi:hypothetical protein
MAWAFATSLAVFAIGFRWTGSFDLGSQAHLAAAAPAQKQYVALARKDAATTSPFFGDVIQAVADRHTLEMSSDQLETALINWAPFTRDAFAPGAFLYQGRRNSAGMVVGAFQQDEKEAWHLHELTFFLPDASNGPQFSPLLSALRTRLGKPYLLKTTKKKGMSSTAAWRISKKVGVRLTHENSPMPDEGLPSDMTTVAIGFDTEQVDD